MMPARTLVGFATPAGRQRTGTSRALAVVVVVAAAASSAFPASAAARTACYDRGYEDLKARNVSCSTAQLVYKRSKRVAARDGSGSGVTRFKFYGLRWRCRARNPPAVAFYTWRCRARGSRLVQYRWKSGD